jgi:type I restriction enzyme, S subunit
VSGYREKSLGAFLRPDVDNDLVEADRIYFTAGIYSHGRGLFRRPPIQGSETSYSKYSRLHTGQFVYSKLFGWEGATAVVDPEFDGLHVSQEFPTFSIDISLAEPRYVRYLAQWNGLHAKLRDKGTGVGSRRQRVSADRLLSTTVPLPDLDEQGRIAARLDSILAKHARIMDLHSRRAKLKGAFAESIISASIGLASKSRPIKKIMMLKRRQVFPESGRTYREIGIRSFGRGVFHKELVTDEQLGDKRVFAIESGDLLFSNVFAWEGAVALAGDAESGLIGSHRFMTYVVNGTVADAAYLKHYFTSSHGLDVIRRASPGSAGRNKTLGIKTFEEQWIPLPNLETQQRIGRVLEAAANSLMVHDTEFINALRLSLLNAAFSAQL